MPFLEESLVFQNLASLRRQECGQSIESPLLMQVQFSLLNYIEGAFLRLAHV